MAHYGRFENANNYIAMVGRKGEGLEERCGYYGEKLVLKVHIGFIWIGKCSILQMQ